MCIYVAVALAAACSSKSSSTGESPGASSPASPTSAWTTTGGPANPGMPSTGRIETIDGGAEGER